MKKLLAIVLTVTLLAVGLVGVSPVQAVSTTIDKTMASGDFSLGDHISVTLDVTAAEAPVTVVDILPEGLSYIPGSFEVDGSPADPDVAGQEISYQLSAVGTYQITFDVQVTSVEAETVEDLTNQAEVRDQYGVLLVSDEVIDLDLLPYDGFEKVVTIVYEDNVNGDVEVNELVQWDMTITVPNNFGWAITDAVLKDNLGGELGMAGDLVDNDRDDLTDEGDPGDLAAGYNAVPDGDLSIRTTGKANKVHFAITSIDIGIGGSLQFVLGIFTDHNPAKKGSGKQCYTSDGEHDLNSGATLKFTDPATGLQLSAHTPPIPVTVVP